MVVKAIKHGLLERRLSESFSIMVYQVHHEAQLVGQLIGNMGMETQLIAWLIVNLSGCPLWPIMVMEV